MVLTNISSNLTMNHVASHTQSMHFIEQLSKKLANILRHTASQIGLQLDEQGFVNIKELLLYINNNSKWKDVTVEDIYLVINKIEKQRFEIQNDKIRAFYGHTFNQKILKTEKIPPHILYHGTSHENMHKILSEGLKSQMRQYVHLSSDVTIATDVGKRKDKSPILLIIDALAAFKDGIKFYIGNQTVWLSDYIPAKYIKILKNSQNNL